MPDDITPEDLRARLVQKQAIVLLDVRDEWETRLCRLENSTHIPIEEIELRTAELNPDDEIVVYCHHGIRSAAVAELSARAGLRAGGQSRGRPRFVGARGRPVHAAVLMPGGAFVRVERRGGARLGDARPAAAQSDRPRDDRGPHAPCSDELAR